METTALTEPQEKALIALFEAEQLGTSTSFFTQTERVQP